MRKISIAMLFLMLLLPLFVFSTEGRSNQEQTNVLVKKISDEAKTTRQYFKQTIEKNKEDAISEFTKRADYYEKSYQNMINTGVLKLGLVLGGLWIFFYSLTALIRLKTEKKRYAVLEKYIKTNVVNELKNEYILVPREASEEIKAQFKKQGESDFLQKLKTSTQKPQQQPQQQQQQPQQPEKEHKQSATVEDAKKDKKLGFFAKRKQKKAEKKIQQLEKELEKEKNKVSGDS